MREDGFDSSTYTRNFSALTDDPRIAKIDSILETHVPFSYSYSLLGELAGNSTFLDIGCGWRSPLSKIAGRRSTELVGADIFKPYLRKAVSNRTHDHFVLCESTTLPFANGSFDVVAALDVIEHLGPAHGSHLIDEMCRVSRKRIVITTMNGFLRQSEYDQNPYQVHRSGWTVQTLRKMGFHVIGLRGFKLLRGERATPRIMPLLLGHFVCFVSEMLLVSRFVPQVAFQLLCVKDKNDESEGPIEHPNQE